MGHKYVWRAQNATEDKGEILIYIYLYLICILLKNKLLLISTLQYSCPGPGTGSAKNAWTGPGLDLGQSKRWPSPASFSRCSTTMLLLRVSVFSSDEGDGDLSNSLESPLCDVVFVFGGCLPL